MNTKSSFQVYRTSVPRAGRGLIAAGAAVALCAAMLGCGKSEASTVQASAAKSAPVAATAAGKAEGPAGPKADTSNFTAEIKAVGSYKAGTEGTVEVSLTPTGGYHINDQYPYKFKVSDPAPEGVTFPKPVLVRADGNFETTKGQFKVPFVAAKSGKVNIAGTLFLSVCSDANCVIDKVPLDVAVDVN